MAVNFTLDYLNKTKIDDEYEKLFNTVLGHTLNYLKKEGEYEISLTLVGEKEIHVLNQKFRGIDRPTDVLTFPYSEENIDFVPVIDLGSVIICPRIAARQAKFYKHSLKRELSFLFIHGILHSFGYDHIKEDEATKMFALQNEILYSLPIDFITDQERLKKELLCAQKHAIAPYSKFHVGAVVVTKDGKYHHGFNIENSAYSACCCGERVALFSTYAKGYTKDDIVSLGCITSSKKVGTCCGVCRQVMSELMNLSCPVYIYNKDESKHLFTTVEELLPYPFGKDDLEAWKK